MRLHRSCHTWPFFLTSTLKSEEVFPKACALWPNMAKPCQKWLSADKWIKRPTLRHLLKCSDHSGPQTPYFRSLPMPRLMLVFTPFNQGHLCRLSKSQTVFLDLMLVFQMAETLITKCLSASYTKVCSYFSLNGPKSPLPPALQAVIYPKNLPHIAFGLSKNGDKPLGALTTGSKLSA